MPKHATSSQYFLSKDKKLEIHEGNSLYRSKVPIRFHLNPFSWIKNLGLRLVKSKRRLKAYRVLDLKDAQTKTLYLTHIEIEQVWKRPVKEKNLAKPKKKSPK